MSFTATWGRPGTGILALQHKGFDSQGCDLASRASMRAVRVLDRVSAPEGEGQWVHDLDSAGDLTQWLCWPNKQGGRQMPGWAQVWPAQLSGGGGGGTPTQGGGGGGGNNTPTGGNRPVRHPDVPSVDPRATDGGGVPADPSLLGIRFNPGAVDGEGFNNIVPPQVVGINPGGAPGVNISGGTGNYNGRLTVGIGGNPATINGQSIFNSGFPQFSFNGSSSLSSLTGIPGVGFGGGFAQFTFGGSNSLQSLTGIPGVGFSGGFVQFIDPTRPPGGGPGGLSQAARNGMNVHMDLTPPGEGGAAGPAGDPGIPGDPGASAGHSCGVFTGQHQMLPLSGADMSPDSRYSPLTPKMPNGDGIPKFPKGLYGLVVSATNEEQQIEYFFPTWTGQLIAVNQAGDPKMGTLVCDLTSSSSLDKDRTAPLQSMMRIAKKPAGGGNAIGWNISDSGCSDAKGGYVGDKPVGGSGDDYGWGLASYLDKGPFTVGGKQDKHRKGMDADNNVVNALHIKTTALFHKDNAEDGPLRFEDVYHEGQDYAQYVKVHLAWTGEDWAWWTSCPLDLPTVRFDPIDPLRPGFTTPTPPPPTYPNFPITPVTPPPTIPYPSYEYFHELPPVVPPTIVSTGSTATGNVPMQMVHASNMLESPGLISQAQNYSPGQANTGTFAGANAAGLAKGGGFNPVSGVMSSFAAQGGTTQGGGSSPPPGQGSQGDPWLYTTAPDGQGFGNGHPPFPTGTASGGWVIHPPETDLRDARPNGMTPPNTTLSTTYLITAPGAWFGAGTPELVNGSIRSGYSWGMDSSTGDLLFRSHTFSETPVNAVRFTNTSQRIQWYSATSFYGELYHANTGNRSYTFPDRTGPLGMMLTGTGSPVASVTAPESTMYWDTTGNALYVNNNSGTAWTAIAGGGGSVTGSGTAGEIAYWDSSSNITSESALAWNAATNLLTVAGGATVTGSGLYAGAPLRLEGSSLTVVVGLTSTAAPSASNTFEFIPIFNSSLGGSYATSALQFGNVDDTAQTGIINFQNITAGTIATRMRIQGSQVLTISGTVTAPSLSWMSDSQSGLYLIGTDNVGSSINQALAFDWNATRLKFASTYAIYLGTASPILGAVGVEELLSIYDSYNGVFAATIKNGSNGNGAFSGWYSMDDLATFVNGMGTICSGKTNDGVTGPNDAFIGVGPLSGITAAGTQRLIIHNRFNSGVIRYSTAGSYRGTWLAAGGLVIGTGTTMAGSELLRVNGSALFDANVDAINLTGTSGSYVFAIAASAHKANLTTPSAPTDNQFQITANTGRFCVLTYDGDNTQVGFDLDWNSSGGWIARHSAVAWIRKNSSLLSFYGSTGNSVGSAATETLMGYFDLSSRALVIAQQTINNEVFRLQSTATNDDPSDKFYQGRVATTDATVTTINTIAIPVTTTVQLAATVRARRTGGVSGTAEDGAGYVIYATYKNVAGTATLIGAVNTVHSAESQAGWDCTFTVSSGNVLLRVTGAVDNDVTWHSTVIVSQVGS